MYSKPKVSVIIPCYNSEKFLEKAVDSALHQSLAQIEIILVDDGSTDKTSTLLQHYKMTDNRVEVITHTKNQGLGAARNIAMQKATGEYITFLDSDDYIHPNALEVLYEKSVVEDLDILQVQHTKHEGEKKEVCPKDLIPFSKPISGVAYYNEGIFIEPKACAKLWKTAFMKAHNLQFDNGYYEDVAMVFYAFSIAERVNNLLFSAYHYIIRNNSISNGTITTKHVQDYKNSLMNIQQLFLNQSIANSKSSFSASFALFLVDLSVMALQQNDKKLQVAIRSFVEEMAKKYRKEITATKRLNFFKRMLISRSPFTYAILKKGAGRV